MRLRSDIWVAAYIRRRNGENSPAMLRRRGVAEAGAIFVKIDRLDGTAALYGPAPQSLLEEGEAGRLFAPVTDGFVPVPDAEERLAREIRFDPDIWIVEVEDPQGRPLLDMPKGV